MTDRRDDPPPSFAPDGGRPRPGADDARVVGSGLRRPPAPGRTNRSTPTTPPRGAERPSPSRGAVAGRTSPAARDAADDGAPASFTPSGTARPVPGRAVPVGGRQVPADAATAPPAPARRSAPRTAAPRTTSSTTAARTPAPRTAPATPGGAPPAGVTRVPGTGAAAPRRRGRRIAAAAVVVVLVVLVAWPVGLLVWANGLLQHTQALSGAPGTPGTTYLLAGSDARGDDGGVQADGTEGQRTDTILVLHVPESGPTALISLPRDTYVEIPGHGASKLNAAFAWGGAPLLVQTVEGLTGLTVDHYVEIGMGGVAHLVDAVGGVNLCYDRDVNDADSGMVWTAGCHDVDGTAALSFARMRKSDPTGDVGRAQRQRQLIGAVMGKVDPRSLAVRPGAQVALAEAGAGAMTFDEGADIVDVARLALAFRAANGEGGVTGTPPIRSMDYRPGNVGSTVQLDPDLSPGFFASLRDGTLPPGAVGGVPTS